VTACLVTGCGLAAAPGGFLSPATGQVGQLPEAPRPAPRGLGVAGGDAARLSLVPRLDPGRDDGPVLGGGARLSFRF
jgi:hypothetical protein